MESEHEAWLDQFAAAAREAARTFAQGWPAGEPLPDPKALVHAMCAAYDGAVDVGRLIDNL